MAEMKKFDHKKYYLGSLCKRGHDYEGTGKSLRYVASRGGCVQCGKDRNRIYHSRVYRKPCPACGRSIGKKSTYCKNCSGTEVLALTQAQVRKIVERKGHIFVGPYKHSLIPINVICGVCGSMWNAKLEAIQQNVGCGKCFSMRISGEKSSHWQGGIISKPNYYRKMKQKNKYWMGVIGWAKTLPEMERLELEELVEAWIDLKITILDAQKTLRESKGA